jgi:hypothetical protein
MDQINNHFRGMITCLLLLTAAFCFAQNRVVLNNNAYLVLNSGSYLVIGNPNANALTTSGTGGNIISEAETGAVRWQIGSSTGNYVIPFYDPDNAQKIPFSINITSAGNAAGRIDFSTYDNASWDNNSYRPSDVSNMNSLTGGPNNSSHVIDRFWIVDAGSYTSKPGGTLAFTYIDAEWNAAGNVITESNLGAQRFNTPAGDWDSYLPQGTINTAANTVINVPAPAADLFRSWTLAEITSPLPVMLQSFDVVCTNGESVVSWTTATEQNNDFFTVERSADGSVYYPIAVISGSGNSNVPISYTYTDASPLQGSSYYRLRQTDHNGVEEVFPATSYKGCNTSGNSVYAYSSSEKEAAIEISSLGAGDYQISVISALGQNVYSTRIVTGEGFNRKTLDLASCNSGVYFITVENATELKSFKIYLR